MVASYFPDQMLRNLTPQRMSKAQQREADEQLGSAVAALSRATERLVGRTLGRNEPVRRHGPEAYPGFRKELAPGAALPPCACTVTRSGRPAC